MLKKILLCFFLYFNCLLPVFTQNINFIESTFSSAFSAVPEIYTYHEKSGALCFYQYKDYSYKIIDNENGPLWFVTYSSPQNQKASETDPRPPVHEGDTGHFCMEELLKFINIFSDKSCNIIYSGMKIIENSEYSVFDVSYCYIDENGKNWPMKGELFLDLSSGIPVKLTVEQTKFPEDLYSLNASAIFAFDSYGNCRFLEYRESYTGQYSIFIYRFESVRSFEY
ncbi:MAG: hypothetical protein PQJ46_07370 [Spirochaetales bacterium]|nr:hypothetical protein [Spirochaetales bacterium]